ncbi:hypothetical protein [Pseudomonas aeruginosa]|uniref:hypothetical protein n=1 Tax=Pseudomonas aeruginosa TaxID=287 RepID=UPI0032601CED
MVEGLFGAGPLQHIDQAGESPVDTVLATRRVFKPRIRRLELFDFFEDGADARHVIPIKTLLPSIHFRKAVTRSDTGMKKPCNIGGGRRIALFVRGFVVVRSVEEQADMQRSGAGQHRGRVT